MKKYLLLILVAIPILSFSQNKSNSFQLSQYGFKDYVVLEFEDKTTNQIYLQLKKWFQYNLRNAEYSNYSEIENEYLTYSVTIPNAVDIGKGLTHYTYNLNLDVELRIKENKLRVDLIVIDMPMTSFSGGLPLRLSDIYRKNGELRRNKLTKTASIQLEEAANNLVKDLNKAVLGKVDYKKSDW